MHADITDQAAELEELERTIALANRKKPEPPSHVCRVELQFERHDSQLYTWEGFVELNPAVCHQLIAEEKRK